MKTKILKVSQFYPDRDAIYEASNIIKNSGLVAFPTETVYGLGALLSSDKAIDRLYSIKKRPRSKPFTINVFKLEDLSKLDAGLVGKSLKIARAFWPGPLTIITSTKTTKEKLGFRIPDNIIALELLREVGSPILLPSANISGDIPPVDANGVINKLSGEIELILDGGRSELGIESTIIDVTEEPFKILRIGAISKEELLADFRILFVCTGNSCRSVMAEALMKKFIQQAGLSDKIYVESAGTMDTKGIAAAQNTIDILKEEDIDVSGHKSRPLTPYMLRKADMIYVMEPMHRNIVLTKLMNISHKVKMLHKEGIPDPIGRSMEEYKRTKDCIRDQVENVFLELFEKEKKR